MQQYLKAKDGEVEYILRMIQFYLLLIIHFYPY